MFTSDLGEGPGVGRHFEPRCLRSGPSRRALAGAGLAGPAGPAGAADIGCLHSFGPRCRGADMIGGAARERLMPRRCRDPTFEHALCGVRLFVAVAGVTVVISNF
jgi:hypothetical protein